ncbi:MAG: hypothetical protein NTX53_19565 [candidate division WOR-3 bacterium]|nr:hypothetical protein [candidate division WOR-3 bacterium]
MSAVLWIEDQVESDLNDIFAEAVAAGHGLTYVADATGALNAMTMRKFDFVILDVRIDPGNDQGWRSYYYSMCLGDRTVARVGLQVLRSIWNKNPEVLLPEERRQGLQWLTPDRVGILTVEVLGDPDFLKRDLDELGIRVEHYVRKTDPGDPSPRLRELIERLERDVKKAESSHGG